MREMPLRLFGLGRVTQSTPAHEHEDFFAKVDGGVALDDLGGDPAAARSALRSERRPKKNTKNAKNTKQNSEAKQTINQKENRPLIRLSNKLLNQSTIRLTDNKPNIPAHPPNH